MLTPPPFFFCRYPVSSAVGGVYALHSYFSRCRGYRSCSDIFLDVDVVLPADLEVEMLTPPPSSFCRSPVSSPAGGYKSCSDIFLDVGGIGPAAIFFSMLMSSCRQILRSRC